MKNIELVNKPLYSRRILVCGKGGSGKSTVVALMAAILQLKAYTVMVDGDASNPEELVSLSMKKHRFIEPSDIYNYSR